MELQPEKAFNPEELDCMTIPYFCKGINVDINVVPGNVGASTKQQPCLNI